MAFLERLAAWLRVELDNRFAWYPTEDLAARGDTVRHGIVWVPPMTGWTERWRAA
jgi:hypothetical protein